MDARRHPSLMAEGNLLGLKSELVDKLLELEEVLRGEIPVIVTSGFRAGDPLAHGKGLAVDLSTVGGYARHSMVSAALAVGFPRIGVYEKHVHLDVDTSLPFPVIWSGP